MAKDNEILEELKQIRKLLEERQETEEEEKKKSIWNEFIDFVKKYKVMGLAVAFILGLYVAEIVEALVNDLIMPIITIAMPADIQWETIQFGVFRIGHFIGALIQFLIVAIVIFILVKATKRIGIQ